MERLLSLLDKTETKYPTSIGAIERTLSDVFQLTPKRPWLAFVSFSILETQVFLVVAHRLNWK